MGSYVEVFKASISTLPYQGILVVLREQNKVNDKLANFSSTLDDVTC